MKECPECTTMVKAEELIMFNGICENCFETKEDYDDELVE